MDLVADILAGKEILITSQFLSTSLNLINGFYEFNRKNKGYNLIGYKRELQSGSYGG